VQYSHLEAPLPLWAVQTRYGARPWAAELPSAGRPLSWELLLALRRRGVAVAAVTHACGLSATGDEAIDHALPLPERYDIPAATVDAVARARRVIAVGTSVVRALEGCTRDRGQLTAGEGETDLVVGPQFRPRLVKGLLTGLHDPSASHFQLLQAFAPLPLLERAYAHAEQAGYLGHEFGDSCLIA
jgi:S-adenosylmethionine:tRNA ribosyltransferase-isomerase